MYLLFDNTPMNLTPETRKQCEDAFKWQLKGGFNSSDYQIVTLEQLRQMHQAGELDKGCYTQAAWDKFVEDTFYTVACNNCDFKGFETDLSHDHDSDGSGDITNCCPSCKTDNYLRNL